MSVIADTIVVSNFAAAGRLDLLHLLFGVLHLADTAHAELERGIEHGHAFLVTIREHLAAAGNQGWLQLTSLATEQERQLRDSMPQGLHDGEAVSLAIAADRGWRFLTDDRQARVQAQRMDVPVTGTVGILLTLVEEGLLTRVNANTILREMIAMGYRSPVTELGDLDQGEVT